MACPLSLAAAALILAGSVTSNGMIRSLWSLLSVGSALRRSLDCDKPRKPASHWPNTVWRIRAQVPDRRVACLNGHSHLRSVLV